MNVSTEQALPATVRTLPELLAWRVARTPTADAYRHFDPRIGRWVSTTWSQFGARVTRWAEALTTLRLPRGSRVAILLPNGLDAVCMDQAALALALVPVPLHALDNPRSIACILTDSDAALLVTATEAQWAAIAALGEAFPALRHVVIAQKEISAASGGGISSMRALDPWPSRMPTSCRTWTQFCPGWHHRPTICSCRSCRCRIPSNARRATTCRSRRAPASPLRARSRNWPRMSSRFGRRS